jgi:hypothetical protein
MRENENESPAEFVEAQRIQSDRNHPEHQRWANGDPAIVEKIVKGYKAMYGSGEAEAPHKPTVLDPELEAVKKKHESQASAEPADSATPSPSQLRSGSVGLQRGPEGRGASARLWRLLRGQRAGFAVCSREAFWRLRGSPICQRVV